MAGIVEAEKLIKEKRHFGIIIAKGKTTSGMDFVILKNHKGTVTLFDYQSDLQFQKGLKRRDNVKLVKLDKYTIELQKYG